MLYKARSPCLDACIYTLLACFAFQVAHPVVRSNAACLLVDAFPLQDSNLNRADAEQYVPGSRWLSYARTHPNALRS